MNLKILCVGVFIALPSLAGEWVLPWVANKDNEWASEIVLNNLGDAALDVSLTAVRPDGSSEVTSVHLAAFSQHAQKAGLLFPTLGSGSGYSVFISAASDSFSAAARVASVNTVSGFSPAMGEAVNISRSASSLVFPTMPADGFSAPAILHLGSADATITITAYTEAGPFGTPFSTTLHPRTPFVAVTTTMFPGLNSGAFFVAQASVPLLGANFSFNSALEPSMINAQPNPAPQEGETLPLLMGIDTASLITATYTDALTFTKNKTAVSKRLCPDVSNEIDHSGTDPLIRVTLDYGAGCTASTGGFHSGVLALTMQRLGGTGGDWIQSTINFNQFNSQYRDSTVAIDGDLALEGAALSKNFVMTADLDLTSNPALFSGSSQMTVIAQLYASLTSSAPTAYGTFAITVGTPYTYSVQASISSSDPIAFDYNSCAWPIDGRVSFTLEKSGQTIQGWLDFGTGDCNTALLHAYGREQIIDLTSIY